VKARVIITGLADADTAKVLADIACEAGYLVASRYNARLESLYERLADHPESCRTRPKFGAHIRVGVVYPYLVIYHHAKGDGAVRIIRVVHGRRRITRELLQGA
jgi:toxin ParE1/3/4